MPYAEGTTVPVDRSQQEIKRLVAKRGATGFVFGEAEENGALVGMVQFRLAGRVVRLVRRYPTKGTQRQRDQEWRRRWRVLLLLVKAKLEAIDDGGSTVEQEFLADILLPDGTTVGGHAVPAVAQSYEDGVMPRLLP